MIRKKKNAIEDNDYRCYLYKRYQLKNDAYLIRINSDSLACNLASGSYYLASIIFEKYGYPSLQK